MTALSIKPAKKGSNSSLRHCQITSCGRPGNYKVFIASWYAGRLCAYHRAIWQKTWDEAAGRVTEEVAA